MMTKYSDENESWQNMCSFGIFVEDISWGLVDNDIEWKKEGSNSKIMKEFGI